MGASESSALEPDGGDMDDAWMERAWKDGAPFTLLHDDAFVAEKYEELRQNGPETLGLSARDDDGDTLEMTGTDELPMDELERMADAARIKLFTVPPYGKSTSQDGEGGAEGRSSSGQKARHRTAANALTAMEGTALARESRERIASERRRTQQSVIVRDYMTRLARRMDKRAKAVKERERQWKQRQDENIKNTTTATRGDGSTVRATDRRAACVPGHSLFQVGSFNMQLEMLRAFRTVSPSLFENSLLALVRTVLEFRPFALHPTQDESELAAVNELLIEDAERFSREMLAIPELSEGHRGLVLVLLLALGVSSGRSGLLVEFVAQVLRPKTENDKLLGVPIGNRVFYEWVEELLAQLESYRVNYKLGTLTDECVFKQVNFKMIRDDASSTDAANKDSANQSTSVATDGSYVYTWSVAEGLSKIGTGQNFTVAGRIYASAPAEQFLRVLREPRTFHAGFYGSGQDATALVQAFVEAGPTTDEPLKTVRDFIGVGDTSQSGRLYVRVIRDDKETAHVFEDSEELRVFSSPEDSANTVQVQFAFYGSFIVISDDALEQLQSGSCENDQDTSSGVVLDSSLLDELLATSGAKETEVTQEKELILLYSSATTSSDLVLEKFAVGEVISSFEERGSDVYHSSLVLVEDLLLLSLLHPTSGEPTTTPNETPRHRPRNLLRISSVDLSLLGEVVVSASGSDDRCGALNVLRATRPLFSYITEGRRLYEVEMSADRFRVQAFRVPKDSNDARFLRSFDIKIKQIQCATFVSCFLKILKTELRVGDLDFALPSFYTNGSYICMMLPSITAVLSDRETHLAARAKFDCLLVDCETGSILSGDEAIDSVVLNSSAEGSRDVKSFERTLPGGRCCFDAANNTIWVVNASRATMFPYKNPGRCIPQGDDEGEILVKRLLDGANRGGQPKPEAVGLRVLTFLANHADDGLVESPDSSSSKPKHLQLFAVDSSASSLSNLLDVAEAIASKRVNNLATDSDLESLRSCLCILQSGMRDKVDPSLTSSKEPGTLVSLQPKLEALLKKLIHENESVPATSQDLNVRVISAALALSASTAHLVDANVNAQVERAVHLVRKWRKGELSQSETVITVSLLRQLCKTFESTSVDVASMHESVDVAELFNAVWNELIDVEEDQLKIALKPADQAPSQNANDDLLRELMGTVNCFVQGVFSRCVESSASLRLALKIFVIGCGGLNKIAALAVSTLKQAQGVKAVHSRVERKIRHGVIRQVAPTMFASATMLLCQWGDIAQTFVEEEDNNEKGTTPSKPTRLEMRRELASSLPSQAESLESLFKSLHELAAALKADEKIVSVATVTRTTRSEVMETSHEYENNLDVTKELRIPGATQMTITFDSQSRTEFNYDYVTFFKDKSQTSFYGEQYYSGRDSEFNWPGVNGLPPLVIDNDHCFVYFHSDASNTDWGYKFTAVGEIYEKATVMQRHWLSALTEMALNVLDETGKLFVEGTQLVPISETEARNDGILHSDLLRHGVGAESEQNAGVLKLLRDFVVPPEGSAAVRVLRAMEEESGHGWLRPKSSLFGAETGATSRNPINTAIRAATAAILHHNMWGMDAYALAQNLRTDVSEQLLRGWKNAQKMRDWFHLGDAAAEAANNGSESPSRRSSRQLLLRRQPSAYKGMSDEALQQLSKNVVERAVFLLEMTPMSFSYVSGAKRRWNFLARYGSALGVGNSLSRSSSDSTLGKWYNLLDELQEATELRSLLTYRRSSSERRKRRQLKSMTEQVLEFIQSDIDVSELRELIQIRNERAKYRASGFQLYSRMFQASFASVRLRSTLIDSCSASLRQLALLAAQTVALVTLPSTTTVDALPTPMLHFGTLLSGCDGQLRKEVNGAFGVCLSQLSRDLASLLGSDNATLETEYTVSMIKAICIDYDIDDMYLLQESNILPLLLRLLASDASRVRRSAQVLLNVFLSRLVEAGGSDDQDASEASLFQKQLFATVGLQLEGVTSLLRDLAAASSQGGNCGSMWRYREQNLARTCSSLTVPVSKDCDLKWNHSIMLWMYVSSSLSSYALKFGDEVRRGPSWGDSNESAENACDLGVVTAITSPTTVRVKWTVSTEECEHAFDPKEGKLDVILARESVGGVVFSKGTRNLAKDSALAAPWSHFGLFLNDRRQLSYKISCGYDKECVYETNYELDANDWAHVAIIQNEEVLKFYVNGLLVTQHLLDPFLILRKSFSASESKITESAHPVTESFDQYWPIHIPGASKIRVTFDPLSEIEQSSGFVRFYKNARCNEIWGEDKYTGRYHDPERNFPGALSNRHRSRRSVVAAASSQGSLEIPSDRFLVYFSHSGESSTWGFRLLATPEFASSSSSGGSMEQPSLNAHPFFIGEPPGRILDAPAAKCWLYQPEMLNVAMAEDEIVEAMQSSCPSAPPQELPLDRALHVIGLLHTCSETSLGRELIATPENAGDLITIAFDELAPVEVRCAGVIVLRQLCSSLSAEFIDEQLHRTKSMEVEPGHGFAEFVFSALVRAIDVWGNYAENRLPQVQTEESTDTFEENESMPPCPMEFQISATESIALATAYASLVRRLAASEAFQGAICQLIESSLGRWHELQNDKEWTSVAAQIIAVLSLLGGSYSSVSVGGRVKCCANIDGKETIETGYLLRYQQNCGLRTARILFDCDPANPVDVPVSDVAFAKDEDDTEVADFVQAVTAKLTPRSLERLFHPLLTKLKVDIPLEYVSFKPKVARKENVEVLESEHPYVAGEDVTYPLRFRGADEMVIYFDELSSTGGQNDYVSFMKRSDDNRQMSRPESNNGKAYWGEERYYGESFPGVRGAPPLRIPASSVDVHFHTESTSMDSGVPTSEWGFKLTAHAYEETLTQPPEVPPTFFVNAMNDIRARAIKSLHTCVQVLSSSISSDSDESFEPLASLMPYLASIANSPDDGRPTQCSPRTQTFESKHPYANSVKECMAITFSGAARLVITFDPRSRTEQTSDYVCFFKDKSLTDRWGEYQYSGVDETGNWPGFLDRPPLVIPSDSFTLLWTTDASNVDWGWRFTVSAEYPVITPLALGLHQLDKQAHDMWEIFYEGIGPQRIPFAEEYGGFEKVSSADELQELRMRNDPTRSLLFSKWREDSESHVSPMGKKFRVLDADGIDMYQSPNMSASVLAHLKFGDELRVVEEKKSWLKARLADEAGAIENFGWVKQRSGDKVHVVNIETAVRNEDVLVLGIDDRHVDQLHNSNSSLNLDDDNDEHDVLVNFVSQYSYEVLKGQSVRYQSLAYDTHRALAIKYARATLGMILGRSAKKPTPMEVSVTSAIPVQVRDFGSANELLLFLSNISSDQDHSLQEAQWEESVKSLLVGSSARGDSSVRELIDRCVEVLESSGDLLPKGRGAMRMLESRHPYLDDVDQYWQLAVPGAKKILVYFDPRSKSETGCDWVCFYKNGSDRGEFFGETQYSGRNGTENWPGCGGRLPLVVDADSFEVHFHSDANQNDWGFKLYAVGVFDEDDIDDGPGLDQNKLGALVELMRLCLRVLLVAAKACITSSSASVPELGVLRSSVFSARVVQALAVGLNDHPQQVRPLSLQLLQTLMQDTQFTHSVPSSLVEELRNLLATKIRAQFVAEERLETKSEYLQMLVECALFVDLAIDSACFRPHYRTEGSDSAALLSFSSSKAETSKAERAICEWSTQIDVSKRESRSIHLQFHLRSVSAALQINFSIMREGVERENLLRWNSDGKITVSPLFGSQGSPATIPDAALRSGDIISIHVDLDNLVVVLRKNAVCVHATVSGGTDGGGLRRIRALELCVSTSSASDQVAMRHLPYSPLASLPHVISPNWYNKVCDAMGMLLDFKEQRIASVVECESEHPLAVSTKASVSHEPERISIDDAVALEVRFDRRTALHKRHRLRFSGSEEFKTELLGICGSNCDEEYPALFLVDPLKRTGNLKPGDRIIRSSDWCYADEDGGRGCVGVVEEIVSWNGRSGCGVRVRWESSTDPEDEGSTGVYRYGYDGCFDVQLVHQPHLWDAPLVIPGNTLEYALDCVEEDTSNGKQPLHIGDDQDFQGTLRIDSTSASTLSLDVRKTKLMLGDDCTIECWFCLSALTIESQVLFEIATLDPSHSILVCAAAEGAIFVQARTAEDLVGVSVSDQTRSSSTSEVTVVERQWFHLGVVFSSSRLHVYVNGERTQMVSLDQKLIHRSLYVDSLVVGGRPGFMPSASGLVQARGHVCDVQVWDVALHSEQIHSHAHGIDGASPRDSIGWQSPASSMPQAPRKLSRQTQLSQLLPPPSPPRSPRSPSRGMNIPPHQKKWIMVNRTGRELATVRANCAIDRDCLPSTTSQPLVVCFEAHVLSTGRLSVGWVDVDSLPLAREQLLGEYSGSIGIELPRRRALFNGDAIDLENPSAAFEGLRSPRRRSSSGSSAGTGFADVFSREGDVIGCAFAPATNDFSFYLNGDLLLEMRLGPVETSVEEDAPASQEEVQENFESLVDEMLTLGFSREASEDALEASAGSTPIRTVQRAIDWLIDESTVSQRDSAALSSPRRLSANSPFASPRRRLSSNSIAMTQLRRVVSAEDGTRRQACFVPAATLGAQGAQGIAWNLGQRPFKYAPSSKGVVLSAMQAANCTDKDGERVHFEVFDHSDKKWERAAYRHRLQDLVPILLARWKLDEGSGTTVYDSSGRDQVGTIQVPDQTTNSSSSSAPLSPRSRRPVATASWWDSTCLPPVAVTRGSEAEVFGESGGSASVTAAADLTVWGYRFYVVPHFSEVSIGRRRFQTQAHRFIIDGPATELRHDQQVVKYVNKVAVGKQLNVSQVLRASWSELAPPESELVKWPVLVEIATGVSPSIGGEDLTAAVTKAIAGSSKAAAMDRLTKRFKLLQELNSAVSRLLPFTAFADESQDGGAMRLDALIREQRQRVFHAVKRGIWDEALKRTTEKGHKEELIVNRPKAMRHRVSGKVDIEGRFALFSQAFRQLNRLSGGHFRRSKAIYHVQFLGENAQDAGGPYRETLAQFADELHSSQLPLLIASSNAQHNVGAAREKWVLNPSATGATQLQMLEFLGKLIGSAMRSQEFLSLQIALLIWKQLAGESVTVSDDLSLVDSMIVSSMQKIRTIDQFGVSAEMFEDIVMETFTTLSTDNRLVPLKPHGASIPVTFENRIEFADLVEAYRLHEFDTQTAALLCGLAKVVPVRLLSLFTGAELEQMVCGSPEVDVDLLQRCTEYSSCSPNDEHIMWFWQVLRDFSHDERSVFLRFVWGRSRLPPNEKEFPQRFKLQSFNKPVRPSTAESTTAAASTALDGYLPIAHTCFFSVELPRYSSQEVLREKLVYAMYNCQEIDGDGDSVAANQLGWEE